MTAVTTSFTNAAFGEGIGPIWMSNLTCVFNEASLFRCSRQVQIGWVENSTSCSHSNDVAVRCSPRNGSFLFSLFNGVGMSGTAKLGYFVEQKGDITRCLIDKSGGGKRIIFYYIFMCIDLLIMCVLGNYYPRLFNC